MFKKVVAGSTDYLVFDANEISRRGVLLHSPFTHRTARRTLKGRCSRHVLHGNPSHLSYFMFLSRVLSALVALLLLASVRAEMNVTIDDMDPRVLYQPAGGWSFLGNVRPSSSSQTTDTGTHIYGRLMPHRIEWVRRHIIHPRLGQQHLSPSLLRVLSTSVPLDFYQRPGYRVQFMCTISGILSRRCLHLPSFLRLSNPGMAVR